MNKLYILFVFFGVFFTACPVHGFTTSEDALTTHALGDHLMYQSAPVLQAPAMVNSSGFLLVWSPASGATSYILEIAYNTQFSNYVEGYANKTIYGSSYNRDFLAQVIDPLIGNRFYYCRLRAVGPGGTSSYSNVIEVPIALAPPVAPLLFVHYANSSTLFLSWERSSGSTYYELDIATDETFTSFAYGYRKRHISDDNSGTSRISYSATDLPGLTRYYCRVRGVNPSGTTTANSNVVTASTQLGIPDRPLVNDATDVTVSGATLSWNVVHMADFYELDITTNETFENGFDTQTVNSSSITLSELRGNTTYRYRVRAVNRLGASENSREVSFATAIHVEASSTQNYIHTYVPIVKGFTTTEQVTSKDVDEVNWSIQYFDGLGRALQNVCPKASPKRRDLIQPIDYDEYGRETRNYLPFVSTGRNGNYRPHQQLIDPDNGGYVGEAGAFYAPGSDNNIADDDRPFSETIFEPSPLNRPSKSYGPGQDWFDKGKYVDHAYLTNLHGTGEGQEQIIAWTINTAGLPVRASSLEGYVESGGYYSSAQLYIKSTKDEHGKEVREYTNKVGQVILKKVQAITESPDLNNRDHWARTYYIYDDFGNLRIVIQPKLTWKMSKNNITNPTPVDLDSLAFQYKYDARKRMIEKKVPGAEPLYMVYDKRDRVVLTQDGEQRKGRKWSFTKYDVLNRPIVTGIYTHATSIERKDMSELVSTDQFAEAYNGSTNFHGYSNNIFPNSNLEVHTVTYYDNYAFRNQVAGFGDKFKFDKEQLDYKENLQGTHEFPEAENLRVKGQVTGSKVKVLYEDLWIKTVNYYDDKYRPIQSITENHFLKLDILSSLYDFPGKVLRTMHVHNSNTETNLRIRRDLTYDHAGRLLETYHTIGDQTPVLISEKVYNELGELIANKLHSEDNTNFMQAVDFRYNIRGWLQRINNSDLSPDEEDTQDDYFGMELFYNYGFDKPQFNGNISGARWKNKVDDQERAYGYIYDVMNRLTGADYVAGETGNWTKEADRFEVGKITYDLNGNIETLHRNGLFRQEPLAVAEYGITDQLSYKYKGNQLMAVNDAIETPKATKNDFKDNGSKGTLENPEYQYDDNGNMTVDGNKGITVAYNYLNLPKLVDFGGGKYIEYTYDAAATKLKQIVHDGENSVKETDYLGEMVYVNGQLQFIQHEEGRIMMVNNEGLSQFPEYQYHLKDHLGNARVTFTSRPELYTIDASLEPEQADEENATFINYDRVTKVNSDLFNHTEGSDSRYSIRLSGTGEEKIGLSKSLAVMTGDTIRASVHGKYLNPDKSNYNQLVQNIVATVATGGAVGAGPESGAVVGREADFPFGGMLNKTSGDQGVMAYLNYLVFDEEGVLDDDRSGYVALSTDAEEDGSGRPHEELSKDIVITEPGFVYIYLSNDGPTPMDVYFDDFKLLHEHSPIVQADDYYPFGLSFNSYKRENSVANMYLFNGKERQTELGLDVFDFEARMYDPAIARTFQIDPHSDTYFNLSGYSWVANNPISNIDPTGMDFFVTRNLGVEIYTGTDAQNKFRQLQELGVGGGIGSGTSESDGGKNNGGNKNGNNETEEPRSGFTVGVGEGSNFQAKANGGDEDAQNGEGSWHPPMVTEMVGAIEFGFNMAVDGNPSATSSTKGVGMGLSVLATGLTGYNVYDQYKKGGVNNINPVDAVSVSASTVGISAKALSWLGFGGRVTSFTGNLAGHIGIGVTIGQLWYNLYKPMEDLKYAPLYIQNNGIPYYGDPNSPNRSDDW